jgi:hypothetical protein
MPMRCTRSPDLDERSATFGISDANRIVPCAIEVPYWILVAVWSDRRRFLAHSARRIQVDGDGRPARLYQPRRGGGGCYWEQAPRLLPFLPPRRFHATSRPRNVAKFRQTLCAARGPGVVRA